MPLQVNWKRLTNFLHESSRIETKQGILINKFIHVTCEANIIINRFLFGLEGHNRSKISKEYFIHAIKKIRFSSQKDILYSFQ